MIDVGEVLKMIVQNEFIGKLRAFGLNTYESRLWTALLSRGISTAGELSDISNVPRSRTYDVLESLEKKGFIIMKLGKPIKYIAVNPDEVLERVKKKIIEDGKRHAEALENLKETNVLDELKLIHKNGISKVDPSEISGSIKGRTQVYNQIETMIKNCQKYIDIITTEEGMSRKLDYLRKPLRKALERGIRIRIISTSIPKNFKVPDWGEKLEIRQNKDVDARATIVDEKHVIMFLTDDKNIHPSYDSCVWLNTDFFAKSIQEFYNLVWDKSKK